MSGENDNGTLGSAIAALDYLDHLDPFEFLFQRRVVRRGVRALKAILPPDRIGVTEQAIGVAGLPDSLDGLRILLVGDFHWHPGSELARTLPAVATRLAYDVAVYIGDFIDDDAGIDPIAAILERMPPARASFAVLGNHDYLPYGDAGPKGKPTPLNDVERLRGALRRLGVTMLDNTATPFGSSGFYIAGVDDYTTHHADVGAALGAAPPDAATVLLSHNPDVVLGLGAYRRRPGLILAGHTHGGQVRLPVVGAVVTRSELPRRYAMGLTRYGGVPLFVTRGIGYSGLDIRLGCPPEAALLTLRPAPAIRGASATASKRLTAATAITK